MNEEETRLSEKAFAWIKENGKVLIENFATGAEVVSDANPTTIFMAGSPGAGKTEVSKELMVSFNQRPIRIDADEIRALCGGYTGDNAHIFQKAATKGVNMLYDYALKHGINVILDGTFAYGNAMQNIERTLKHKRYTEVFFVYQDPVKAWEFVKIREQKEQRRVSKEIFINSFFKSRYNVNLAKQNHKSNIVLSLLIKEYSSGVERLELNIQSVDPYLPKEYTVEKLTSLLI